MVLNTECFLPYLTVSQQTSYPSICDYLCLLFEFAILQLTQQIHGTKLKLFYKSSFILLKSLNMSPTGIKKCTINNFSIFSLFFGFLK